MGGATASEAGGEEAEAAARRLMGDVPNIACFDTAFHARHDPLTHHFALEQGLRDILGARGIHFETTFVEDAPVVGAAVAGLIAQEA